MLFIGIFGIQTKNQKIKTEQGMICPVCGAYDRFDIVKTFNYFHIFFVPVWKWNKRFFIQTRCCQQICILDQEIGTRIEAGESIRVSEEHVQCNRPRGRVCPNCQERLDSSYNYCPHCGTGL